MGRLEKRVLTASMLLGTALTLLVAAAESKGMLRSIDEMLYDFRARYFQFFLRPPTDKLIHLDIDDRALDTIGAWPWPRSRMAEVLDELTLAGPKVVAFDVLYTDHQELQYLPGEDGSLQTVSNDQQLIDAVRRAGNVIVPFSVHLEPDKELSDLGRRIRDFLSGDPELTEPELVTLLGGSYDDPAFVTSLAETLRPVRRAVIHQRVVDLLRQTPMTRDQVIAAVLKRSAGMLISPLAVLVAEQYTQATAELQLERLGQPIPDNEVELLHTELNLAPIAELTQASAMAGFVDYPVGSTGVIRSAPLLIESGGKAYLQVGLALAAKMLDVEPSQVRVVDGAVYLPTADGSAIRIPTHKVESQRLGRDVPTMVDIAFFGKPDGWQTMYDYPKYESTKQHVPIGLVWEAVRTRQKLASNLRQADDALAGIWDVLDPDRAQALRAKPFAAGDIAARRGAATTVLQEALPFVEQYAALDPTEMDDAGRAFLAAATALPSLLEQSELLKQQLGQQRKKLIEIFRGRAVLIGYIATAATADVKPTSVHAVCPGVVVHGVIFNSILNGELWKPGPRWVTTASILLLGLLSAASAGGFAPHKGAILVGGLLLGTTMINGLAVFDYGDTILPLAGPLATVGIVWSQCTLARSLIETRERKRITNRFRSYTDPQLVDYVLENPEQINFAGESRELTVVFTDMAGFTTLTEKLQEGVVEILNTLFGLLVPRIRARRGYVNKFLGDGIMFFFGAPRPSVHHATDAVAAVLDMQDQVAEFNRGLRERGLAPVSMRAGISTGRVVVGDVVAGDASDYTVLGDAVNFASRLEGTNKQLGTLVLASERTNELLGGQFLVRPVGRLQVVGKNQAIMSYHVMGWNERASISDRGLAAVTQKVVEAFIDRRFDDCIQLIHGSVLQHGPDPVLNRYRALCEGYQKKPPGSDFHGQLVFTEK